MENKSLQILSTMKIAREALDLLKHRNIDGRACWCFLWPDETPHCESGYNLLCRIAQEAVKCLDRDIDIASELETKLVGMEKLARLLYGYCSQDDLPDGILDALNDTLGTDGKWGPNEDSNFG